MKLVTKMDEQEAKNFFMKSKNYFNSDLPKYFNFDKILALSDQLISGKDFKNSIVKSKKDGPDKYDSVNYKVLYNKDGKYAWRPLEIIHPILYVKLVNDICEKENWDIIKKRFKEFRLNSQIVCCSIPGEANNKKANVKANILRWWGEYEQRTISLAMNYQIMATTDITNCYSSIYTHSIVWALHTKEVAKEKKMDDSLIGNIIDKDIREMSYGQTDGIPQGSAIMDFIAEIVLGYADELLAQKLKEASLTDYKIIRYRDDYRIFCNSSSELDLILKSLSDVLSELNFKMNSAKTFTTNDIIGNTLKKDKVERIKNPIDNNLNLQKQLFLIREFSMKYPNSGSISVMLNNIFYNKFESLNVRPNNYEQIISIIIDIMYNNPRCYPICSALLSCMFQFSKPSTIKKYTTIIIEKFKKLPNTTYLDVWLQRITLVIDRSYPYESSLCKKIIAGDKIWNSDWMRESVKKKFKEELIIDDNEINNMNLCISREEVDAFSIEYDI